MRNLGRRIHHGAEPKNGVDDSDSDTNGHCDVIWPKAGRGVWGLCHVFENTLGANSAQCGRSARILPLYLNCDSMEDSAVPSNLSVLKMPEPDQAATSACAKKGPKPGEHAQLFRMKRDRNKGFYSEKCELEASIALCFEWAGYLVPRDVLPPFHNFVACTERCVEQTLLFGPYFLRT